MNSTINKLKAQESNSSKEKEILDNYVIVTTINKNYLKIFDLWYHFFSLTKYKTLLQVITLDKESDDYV